MRARLDSVAGIDKPTPAMVAIIRLMLRIDAGLIHPYIHGHTPFRMECRSRRPVRHLQKARRRNRLRTPPTLGLIRHQFPKDSYSFAPQ